MKSEEPKIDKITRGKEAYEKAEKWKFTGQAVRNTERTGKEEE